MERTPLIICSSGLDEAGREKPREPHSSLPVLDLVVFILALVFMSCAGRDLPVPDLAHASDDPQPAQVMSLIGRFGIGHACPVNEHIITAAHVAARVGRNHEQYPMSYVYQQGTKTGLLKPSSDHPPSQHVDLGWLDVELGDVPYFNSLARDVYVGDKIFWFEYDKQFKKKRVDSKVVEVIAGHLVTKIPFARGASGGCIFNEDNEVVGIPVWRFSIGVGVGVMLTKKWPW